MVELEEGPQAVLGVESVEAWPGQKDKERREKEKSGATRNWMHFGRHQTGRHRIWKEGLGEQRSSSGWRRSRRNE